jgi:RNA polymerase sigma factor (sigma-70 family)
MPYLERSNEDWLAGLRGQIGSDAQQQAYTDLARFLSVVAYNYLLMRSVNIAVLTTFDPADLAALAEEFVQDTLEKLAAHDHALLDGYRGSGRFTSWAAVIVRRVIAKELKKRIWTQRQREEENDSPLAANGGLPLEVRTSLEECLGKLPERQRQALLRCLVEEESTEDVAAALQTNVNAVYLLVLKAKRKTKECLQAADINYADI